MVFIELTDNDTNDRVCIAIDRITAIVEGIGKTNIHIAGDVIPVSESYDEIIGSIRSVADAH